MNPLKFPGIFIFLFLIAVGCQKEQDLTLAPEAPFKIEQTFSVIQAEEVVEKKCASEVHQQQLLQKSDYRVAYESRMKMLQQQLKKKGSNYRSNCANPIILPVAVHFQEASPNDLACLRQLAVNQVKRLNEDFRGKNADISKWTNSATNHFPGIEYGDACIEFVIANKNHPTGTGLRNGDLAVTASQNSGDQVSTWAGYLNIFVRDLDQGNTTGYAPIGGRGNGDGVIIDDQAFGTGRGCPGVRPYSYLRLGRTLTHEIGHYMTLDHIWGTGCNSDDGISDTPRQSNYNFGCPTVGVATCGSKDMHMNYMDYTNETCQYMYSAGQSNRMSIYANSILKRRLKNPANVADNVANQGDSGSTDGGNTTISCTAPTTFEVEQIDNSQAAISWNYVAESVNYQLRIAEKGYNNWSTYTTNAAGVTYYGLQPGIIYEYEIRTNCYDDSWSDFSSTQTFSLSDGSNSTPNTGNGDTATNGCASPTNIQVSKLDNSSLNMAWSTVTDAIAYQVEVRIQGYGGWYTFDMTYNNLQLSGMESGYTYDYQIRAKCRDGSWSAFSDIGSIRF